MAAEAIVGAIVGIGTAIYSTQEQKKAVAKAEQKQQEATELARAEELRILKDTAPEQDTAATIAFGTGADGKAGTYSDFLVPRTNTALGTSPTASSGLGFNV